jgi:hypothetical protein
MRKMPKHHVPVAGPFAAAAGLGLLLPASAAAQGLPVDTGSHLPVALWAIGTAILGLALAYGIMRNRTRTNLEKRVTEQATENLYAEENQKERNTGASSRTP